MKKIKIKKIDIVFSIIVFIIIMTYIFLRVFTYRSEKILIDYVKNESINIINSFINESANKVVYSEETEIINIDKNNNGDIVSLNFDNKRINRILYNVTNNLLNNLYDLENGNYNGLRIKKINDNDSIYYVPSGVISNLSVLTLVGPKIPFKIKLIGNVNNEIKNEIREYGINSSIIEVFLSIKIEVQVILPFKTKIYTINKNVLLDSKIIQGNIPKYYGGLINN